MEAKRNCLLLVRFPGTGWRIIPKPISHLQMFDLKNYIIAVNIYILKSWTGEVFLHISSEISEG